MDRDLCLVLAGTVKDLWMPSIKTHAFAIFGSVEEAEATRQALWDVEWPDGRNNTLKPKCVLSFCTFLYRL